MKDIPSKSVDLVLTDPPYGVSDKYGIAFKSGKPITMDNLLKNGFRDDMSDNKMINIFSSLAEHFDRILKNDGSILIFHDRGKSFLMKPLYDIFNVRNSIVFITTNPPPYIHKNNYRSGYQQCAWFSRDKCKVNFINQESMVNVFYGQSRKHHTDHPTEKPAWMIVPLIRRHSNPGDLILDPFCGSGRVCVEAKMLGRNYIGIDIEPKWCETARRWLEETPESAYGYFQEVSVDAREWFK